MKIFVTGGAGFIGSAVIRHLINDTDHSVVNIDALTYAANLQSLTSIQDDARYTFERANICDHAAISALFEKYKPDAIMHLAAESHVDRSIDGAMPFIQTNIVGTYTLLDIARSYVQDHPEFRFHHISTDEVFGDLSADDPAFTETSHYEPSSPYSASKAASDHLVRAWHRTYGLPVVLSNCSNNYGPYHHPEKLIPHMILNALHHKPLPVYGDGNQIRDWLYVDDHARALVNVLLNGAIGESYNIGGHNEVKNLDVVHHICDALETLVPLENAKIKSYRDLITFVKDRPGHDRRYAIDATKIEKTLAFKPQETFESGMKKTIQWYLDNAPWWTEILDEKYDLKRIGEAS